ncbi:DUF2971 domain-containing protein [Xanthomonas sacchari]|uniref:DUF2971 domain-containing protein n=1 Tax=Xanthomonas sacchari TaxID=56458 RepID=UPI00225603C1|nr:DUF2971 domain-containing protein [Xanthomonas sacchari]UYK66992.1 DUF2971 domain-containing protein [Xanthomonas sacchari]
MNTPSAGRLAFKYRSGDATTLPRDLKALADAAFYAADRHSLNDPFEGRFDRSPLDTQFELAKNVASVIAPKVSTSLDTVEKATGNLLSFADKSGIFSLSYNPLQELIWAHYGGSHQGFCIGYDLEKLTSFEPNVHRVIEVHYSNTAPTISTVDLMSTGDPVPVLRKMLGVKSKPWSYEEEVRLVTQPPGLHDHDFRATKTVYFGLRCPESTIMAVMETLAGRGVTYQQVVSPPSSYTLKSVAILDRFASAPTYKANVAPISEGAIYLDDLKPEQKQYAAYLRKAAEIVRREPYCQEIQLVDFSSEKSTPTRPVIFVQYQHAPNKWVNHYFTLPEIDKLYPLLQLPNDV